MKFENEQKTSTNQITTLEANYRRHEPVDCLFNEPTFYFKESIDK